MKKYNVTGMSCAACSARVEKAVKECSGVTSCSVNLLTSSMVVEGDISDEKIIKAVKKAGYGIEEAEAKKSEGENGANELKGMKIRLFSSILFLIVLMYFSMGHVMWNFPVGEFFEGNYVAIGLVQLILSAIIMVINQKFFISGTKGILNKAPNMDTLVSLGATASFIYSTVALFLMTDNAEHHLLHELYFESAGMILTLITLGKLLEAYSKGKTTSAIKSLMALKVKTAVLLVDGKEVEVEIESVKKGDIFVVRPGESIPCDGLVIEGKGAVDEAALTGESMPADKEIGSRVFASSVNLEGYLKCEATDVGEDTTFSKIIKMVEGATSTKAPIAKIADKVSGVFVPFVILIASITFIVWLLVGESIGFALARSVSVLVISCPCALGLATPVAIMVGSGVGAKGVILFKTAEALEMAGKTEVVVLDKTGTVTKGQPAVTDVFATGCSEEELLKYAYALEIKSEHPLAKAVVAYGEERLTEKLETVDFKALPGNGLEALCQNEKIIGGKSKFIAQYVDISEVEDRAESFAKEGKTPLFFAKGEELLGIIAVADEIKSDSCEAVAELVKMGIKTVMLTGDNRNTAEAIAKKVGVTEVYADTLPDEKAKLVERLKKHGRVMMVGDGINDAPALATADISAAIGSGVDIAIESADVVLMKSSLKGVPQAVRLSRKTLKNIKENLFLAFIYNFIGIPLAAGVYIASFGWELNPMFGAAAMSLSSFCVVTNALRLNFFDITKHGGEGKTKISKRDSEEEITLSIEGMMCAHCEQTVTKILERHGARVVRVSHEEGTAVFENTKNVKLDKIKKDIEKAGYSL